MQSGVCYAAWRIGRRCWAGRGTQGRSSCACSPRTPRSRSASSRPTRTWARPSPTCTRRWPRRTRAWSTNRSTRRGSRASTSCSAPCPHGHSQAIAAQLVDTVGHVVDLGADFRLPQADYERWYGEAHAAPELIERFTYGMTELYRDELATARHVAAPGCYPTTASLALAPLLAGGLVDPTGHRRRRGLRGVGRRSRPEGDQPVRRGVRQRHRVRPAHAPSHRGDGAGAVARRRAAGAGAVHAAPRPDVAGDPRHLLRPPRRRPGSTPTACSRSTPTTTPTSRSWW